MSDPEYRSYILKERELFEKYDQMSESSSSLPQSVKDRIEKEVEEKMQPNLSGNMYDEYESGADDDMYEVF